MLGRGPGCEITFPYQANAWSQRAPGLTPPRSPVFAWERPLSAAREHPRLGHACREALARGFEVGTSGPCSDALCKSLPGSLSSHGGGARLGPAWALAALLVCSEALGCARSLHPGRVLEGSVLHQPAQAARQASLAPQWPSKPIVIGAEKTRRRTITCHLFTWRLLLAGTSLQSFFFSLLSSLFSFPFLLSLFSFLFCPPSLLLFLPTLFCFNFLKSTLHMCLVRIN